MKRNINYAIENWELLYILSCPVAITCEKQVFFLRTLKIITIA